MRLRSLITLLACAAVLGAVAVAPLAGGAVEPAAEAAKKCESKKTKKIKVGDDFFAPAKSSVKKCTKVKWKWLPENGNPHNVTLTKGPKGVKKKDFTSATGSIGIKFNRKMKKPGTYKFVCTIHRTVMKQTLKVKR